MQFDSLVVHPIVSNLSTKTLDLYPKNMDKLLTIKFVSTAPKMTLENGLKTL